ncbi:hypothetical protein GW891_02855 [bacterium]|nr:hypothetical protein [bacterium]
MQNAEFKEVYYVEKLKLDIEFMLDELSEKIKMEQSYNHLLKGVNKMKLKINRSIN